MASQPQSPTGERERRAQLLDRLLRDEGGRLLRWARFHSQRFENAEDALSDACVQFLRFYDGPADEAALRWMMVVVKRCAWAIDRKARGRDAPSRALQVWAQVPHLSVAVADERIDPDDLLERYEETAQVIKAIEQLKPDERTALILFGLGCSYVEIGELRGWSATKVRRCLSEGRARVRKLLERGVS